MPAGTWIIERGADSKFPFRITILGQEGASVLVLRAQDRWPTANRNIFCLRAPAAADPDEPLAEIERVAILALQRRGVRLSLILDRKRFKRCDFLFLTREYKSRPGQTYEQIYWQTQTAMVQRRPTVAPSALRGRVPLTVRIASDERYPWHFPGSSIERGPLADGDYALIDAGEVAAVVERKTLENLLHDFGVMPVLHQRLLELALHEQNALVVEAPFEDFLNPAKVHHYSPAFCAAAIAELYAAHPRLRVVFCSNRKTANAWTANFFAAVQAQRRAGLFGSSAALGDATAVGRTPIAST